MPLDITQPEPDARLAIVHVQLVMELAPMPVPHAHLDRHSYNFQLVLLQLIAGQEATEILVPKDAMRVPQNAQLVMEDLSANVILVKLDTI